MNISISFFSSKRFLQVFENHKKSLIQHCERSDLHLPTFWVNKSWLKMFILVSFWKPEFCSQTVLPDINWDILGDFQTLCLPLIYSWWENSPPILWCFPPFANKPFSPCHIPRQVQQLKWKFHQVVLLKLLQQLQECKNQENCAAELEITLNRL